MAWRMTSSEQRMQAASRTFYNRSAVFPKPLLKSSATDCCRKLSLHERIDATSPIPDAAAATKRRRGTGEAPGSREK